jgi:hypothetical protein
MFVNPNSGTRGQIGIRTGLYREMWVLHDGLTGLRGVAMYKKTILQYIFI